MYGHMDKQPWGEGWAEGLGPLDPVLKDDHVYGRGASDDGYALYASLLSLKACQALNLSHPKPYIIIEGSEASSE